MDVISEDRIQKIIPFKAFAKERTKALAQMVLVAKKKQSNHINFDGSRFCFETQ
jgi:hypothetical protein